jgi:hypothetical protein
MSDRAPPREIECGGQTAGAHRSKGMEVDGPSDIPRQVFRIRSSGIFIAMHLKANLLRLFIDHNPQQLFARSIRTSTRDRYDRLSFESNAERSLDIQWLVQANVAAMAKVNLR